MTRLQEYEQALREFDFSWCSDAKDDRGEWNSDGWADEMKEREWQLLIEAEHLGVDAVKLFRQYQLGVL